MLFWFPVTAPSFKVLLPSVVLSHVPFRLISKLPGNPRWQALVINNIRLPLLVPNFR